MVALHLYWSKEAVVPGTEGSIEITFMSAGKMGKQHIIITIESNVENTSERISITLNIFPTNKNK